jgi:subtilase family serine protease
LRSTDLLYVDVAIINDSNINTGAFRVSLYVDGVYQKEWQYNDGLSAGDSTSVEDYSYLILAAGEHTLKVVVDSSNTVAESHEDDNVYERTVTVEMSSDGNLRPYRPDGWSDKIVVSNAMGTTTDNNSFKSNDEIYVDWAIENGSRVDIRTAYEITLYVDGVNIQIWSSDILRTGSYNFANDYNIGPLTAGQHTIKIVADSNNTVIESNEDDNVYEKTIMVEESIPDARGSLSTEGRSTNTGGNDARYGCAIDHCNDLPVVNR